MMLKIFVGHRAKPVVGLGKRPFHFVGDSRIVITGEEHQRPVPDVAVGVLARRLEQVDDRHRPWRPSDDLRRLHAGGVVERPEMVDGVVQRFRRDRRGCGCLLEGVNG